MRYNPTPIGGAFVIDLEQREDERGFFARLFCAREFVDHGLDGTVAQVNDSVSAMAGTLRGLHYQVAPRGESKLVRCVRGSAFDVLIDVRERSQSFLHWFGVELSAANRRMLYVPKGCAHGFLTLEPDTEMIYLASAPYCGACERVLRWDDQRLAIAWPLVPTVLSDKDRHAPDFNPAQHCSGY